MSGTKRGVDTEYRGDDNHIYFKPKYEIGVEIHSTQPRNVVLKAFLERVFAAASGIIHTTDIVDVPQTDGIVARRCNELRALPASVGYVIVADTSDKSRQQVLTAYRTTLIHALGYKYAVVDESRIRGVLKFTAQSGPDGNNVNIDTATGIFNPALPRMPWRIVRSNGSASVRMAGRKMWAVWNPKTGVGYFTGFKPTVQTPMRVMELPD